MKQVLAINGYAYSVDAPSSSSDPSDRAEENMLFAKDALFDLAGNDMEKILLFLDPLAEFYGVNRVRLLEAWNNHYGAGGIRNVLRSIEHVFSQRGLLGE